MNNIVDIKFFEDRNKFRNYLHFDRKMKNEKIFDYVTNPDNISKHSFFPTISYFLNEKKISRQNKQKNFRKKINPRKNSITNNKTKLRRITLKYYGVKVKYINRAKMRSSVITSSDFKEKPRLINFPSHVDGNIYAYYSKVIGEKYEVFLKNEKLDENIIAFRKISGANKNRKIVSMCNIHFAKIVFDCIETRKNCYVLCLDISGFFDNLNHEILKSMWMKLLDEDRLPKDHYQVFKSLTNYAYVNKNELYKELSLSLNARKLYRPDKRLCDIKKFRNQVRDKKLIKKNLKSRGIPQGSPISGMLSNIYMMNFDKNVAKKIKEFGGEYFRYCDDMIFIFDKDDQQEIQNLVLEEINFLKLKINDKKTQHIEFQNGVVKKNGNPSFNYPHKLQYLGVLYDGNNVFLRETGLSKFHYKLRKAIRMRSAHYKKLKISNRNNNHNMYMRTLYTRFTYIGKRNYLSYVFRVSREFESKNIKRQVKGHFNIFNDYLAKKKSPH
ncbi:antiviral reverse transcriptase Drt2 [Acinetobacter sp.]|uniref:antiviral reverse transcriptase Drt2 n=1 Tax=Acinetobacter sp. TaxID=472 RepID=UPI0038904FB5